MLRYYTEILKGLQRIFKAAKIKTVEEKRSGNAGWIIKPGGQETLGVNNTYTLYRFETFISYYDNRKLKNRDKLTIAQKVLDVLNDNCAYNYQNDNKWFDGFASLDLNPDDETIQFIITFECSGRS